jgi:hypothetical protein
LLGEEAAATTVEIALTLTTPAWTATAYSGPEVDSAFRRNGGARPATSKEKAPLTSGVVVRALGDPAALRDTVVTGDSAEARPDTVWGPAFPDGLLELPQPRVARVSAADTAKVQVAFLIFTLLLMTELMMSHESTSPTHGIEAHTVMPPSGASSSNVGVRQTFENVIYPLEFSILFS